MPEEKRCWVLYRGDIVATQRGSSDFSGYFVHAKWFFASLPGWLFFAATGAPG
ncbi:hypothetical protein [Janthinobacterium sp. HLX7-2]|uniref:hypothetical protein n=1 Tax=Janthinobacterium sp. HLX7-2 TaxID=1259331 RepID=UPI003F2454DD